MLVNLQTSLARKRARSLQRPKVVMTLFGLVGLRRIQERDNSEQTPSNSSTGNDVKLGMPSEVAAVQCVSLAVRGFETCDGPLQSFTIRVGLLLHEGTGE